MSSKDDRLALSVVLRACAHVWHKCLSGCPYSLARAFLFTRRSVASSSFLLRNVAMSQSGSQAVRRVSRRVSRTVSRSLRFVHQSQTSGRNRLRSARRNSPKKPPQSKPKSTKNRSREAPGAPKIDLGAPRVLQSRPGSDFWSILASILAAFSDCFAERIASDFGLTFATGGRIAKTD